MGLATTQMIATVFNRLARPLLRAFEARCEEVGFKHAAREGDGGEPTGGI